MSLTASPEVCPNPVRHPVMVQRWADLAYLHWQVDEREVRDQLPAGLYPDLHEGTAWVGLVPFEMRGLRVRGTPPLPWVRRFVEVNVRTYVRDESGRPGVWFHSLDASRLGATIVARVAFGLPYFWSRARYQSHDASRRWTVTRRGPAPRPAHSVIEIAPGPARTAGPLDHFLSARWGMFTAARSHLAYGAVSHQPWPLHDAQLLELDDSLVAAAGYCSASGEPHVMWSPGVDVAIGRLRRVDAQRKPDTRGASRP